MTVTNVSSDSNIQEMRGLSETQEPKYTVDGRSIINRASGESIPDDEPVFILRARDKRAVESLCAYQNHVRDRRHAEAVWFRIEDFLRFAREHPERMKEPDTESRNMAETISYGIAPTMTNGMLCPWPQCKIKGSCNHPESCGDSYDPEEG